MQQVPANLVEIRNLAYSVQGRSIFSELNIRIRRGKLTAILGPSAAGKTTLLKLIGGQLQPDSGQIRINGESISSMTNSRLFEVRKDIGMLFQNGALFSDLTVQENVAFPIREHTRLPEAMILDQVLLKLNAVGLLGARYLKPAQLSGGMARRVALARAMALDPKLVLYDEPFAGQDPISKGVLVNLLKKLSTTLNLTSVLVSHDIQECLSIADYVYLIASGRVIEQGAPQQLRDSSSSWVKQFLQGKEDGPVPFHYPGPSLRSELFRSASA